MISIVVAVALAAAPFKGASAGISLSGIPPERGEFYSEFVAQQMAAQGVSVVTPKQIATLLGLERQRELLGCSESATSCIAEMASALGVDGVVMGEAAKLESGGFQVSLKVVWSRDGRPLIVFTGRATDEGGLLDVMGKGAQLMARDLTEGDWVRLTTAPASHSITPSSPTKIAGLTLLGVGAVFTGVGVLGFVRSGNIAQQLGAGSFLSRDEAVAVASEGKVMQTMGFVGLTVGAACLVSGALLTLLGFSGDVRPVAWLSPQSVGLGWAGGLP